MAVSKGKEFEGFFRKATEKIQSEGFQVDIHRLYDVVGKKTIEQPSDFICYRYPNEIYVECKSTHDTSFSYFTQPQYERLIKKSKISGVKAGMLVWFVKKKRIFWMDIDWMQAHYKTRGVKSVSISVLERFLAEGIYGVYEVKHITPRINPTEIFVEGMFKHIVGEE